MTNSEIYAIIIDRIINSEADAWKTFLKRFAARTYRIFLSAFLKPANEDRQEADNYLKLRTDVSGPFLVWDLTYRNLMNRFDEDDV